MRESEAMFSNIREGIREIGFDIRRQFYTKTLYEYLGIEFSLTPLEMDVVELENTLWDDVSELSIMPDADKMLDYLNKNSIRTGIISNLPWSGDALRVHLDKHLPNNRFDFVMTSCDYLFKKPNRILFDIALQKSGLCANEVWFCGDTPEADVEGAAKVGIFPVLYDNDAKYKNCSDDQALQREHLHIYEWTELNDTLERIS